MKPKHTLQQIEWRLDKARRDLIYLHEHPEIHAELAKRLKAKRKPEATATEEDIIVIIGCDECDNDELWDFVGGSIARCSYCGPLGLGCLSWSECWNGEE